MPLPKTPTTRPVSRRVKRVLAVASGIAVVVVVGVIAWSAFNSGSSYGNSKNGCITLHLTSSMGGAITHQCGAAARTACRKAYAGHDQLSALTRPQCRLAGLTAANTASGGN